jgi:hypothetical protein
MKESITYEVKFRRYINHLMYAYFFHMSSVIFILYYKFQAVLTPSRFKIGHMFTIFLITNTLEIVSYIYVRNL